MTFQLPPPWSQLLLTLVSLTNLSGETLCDLSLSDLQRDLPPLPLSDAFVASTEAFPESPPSSKHVGGGVGVDGAFSRLRHVSHDSTTNYPSVELEPASPHRRSPFIGVAGDGRQQHRTSTSITPHDLISTAYPPPSPHMAPDASLAATERRAVEAARDEEAEADDGYDEGIDDEEDYGRTVFVLDSPYVRWVEDAGHAGGLVF